MAGPWEAFQAPDAAPAGPWEAYAKPQATPDAPNLRKLTKLAPGGEALPDIAMGAKQAWDSAAQMLARAAQAGPGNSADVAANETLDAYNKYFPTTEHPTMSAIARGIGQAGVTAPLLPALGGAGVVGNAAKGAAAGAGGSALTPVYGTPSDADFWKQKLDQLKSGAGWGAVFGGGGTVMGKMLSPVVDKAKQALSDAGIRFTPGQAAGGVAKSIEDRVAGFPVIGDLISARRFEGITDFNRAIYSKALDGFGEEGAKVAKAAQVGNDGIKAVGDFLSQKYQSVLPQTKVAADQPFVESMGQLAQMVQELPADRKSQFMDIIRTKVADKFRESGQMSGETMKAADSALGRLAANYRGSLDGDQRLLGDAIRQAQQNLRDMVARQNPELQPVIEAANKGWATLAQMENAGAMLGAKDGIFTPSQFLNAVKRSDRSVRDRQFARGDALNQEFAQSAERVLPNKIPDSGTTGRALTAYIASELTGAGAGFPGAASGMITAGSLPYLPGVSPSISRVMMNRPGAMVSLGDLLRGQSPYLGAPGAAAAMSP